MNFVNSSGKRNWANVVVLVAWLWTGSAFGDGKVFPAAAYPADVQIPDQSALLVWSNGVERLVIETRFVGDGTNFAWVVPLPAVPDIEPATVGLFPTLRYSLQPELRHDVYSWWAVSVFVFGLTWLLATVRRDQPRRVADLFACLLTAVGFAVATHSPHIAVLGGPLMFFLLLVTANRVRGGKERVYAFLATVVLVALLAAMLLPALATGGKSAGAKRGNNEVQVLDRKIVGIFDTTTIAAKESEALAAWLTANGFAVGADARPVIDELVRDGWVFVATKLQRESDSRAPATPHPLSFTFKSAKPVYPVRLTGVGNTQLTVELFVVGTERAHMKGFKVTECRRIEPATYGNVWQSSGFRKLKHPQFLAWAGNASVITRLEAKLDAADMRQDAEVTWQGFRNAQSRLYSKQGAVQTAANWTVPFALLAGLLVILRAHRGRMSSSRAAIYSLALLFTTAMTILVVYFTLPKVAIRLQRWPGMIAQMNLRQLGISSVTSYPTNQPVDLGSVRKHIEGTLALRDLRWSENVLLGGNIREEDSPGNYTLRETADGVEIIGYDATGADVPLGLISKPMSP